MKIHVDMEISPEEARTLLGLPDLKAMQDALLAEMQKRVKGAIESYDPEAIFRACMPMGTQGLEQFQRFLWDGATGVSGTRKRSSKD